MKSNSLIKISTRDFSLELVGDINIVDSEIEENEEIFEDGESIEYVTETLYCTALFKIIPSINKKTFELFYQDIKNKVKKIVESQGFKDVVIEDMGENTFETEDMSTIFDISFNSIKNPEEPEERDRIEEFPEETPMIETLEAE